MIRSLFGTAVILLAAAACETTSTNPGDERARMLAMRPALDSIPQSGLGPQELLAGECGLFLWSQTDVSKFIFYSKALTGTALFAQNEVPISLTQTTAGGNIFGQFNTSMSYVSEDGRQFGLTMVPGEELEGGQRIESGLLSLIDNEGWQTKLPVLGVRACQPE